MKRQAVAAGRISDDIGRIAARSTQESLFKSNGACSIDAMQPQAAALPGRAMRKAKPKKQAATCSSSDDKNLGFFISTPKTIAVLTFRRFDVLTVPQASNSVTPTSRASAFNRW